MVVLYITPIYRILQKRTHALVLALLLLYTICTFTAKLLYQQVTIYVDACAKAVGEAECSPDMPRSSYSTSVLAPEPISVCRWNLSRHVFHALEGTVIFSRTFFGLTFNPRQHVLAIPRVGWRQHVAVSKCGLYSREYFLAFHCTVNERSSCRHRSVCQAQCSSTAQGYEVCLK